MDVRAHIAMMFHLDKCIGCHTCSIACKNVWTDRKGAEYMWWNNVETKPGTGYPTLWENQQKYQGGWEKRNGSIELRSTNKAKGILNIFHNPNMPNIDDYYEPFTYKYQDLIDSPEGTDQPTARPVSMVTGKPMDINAGPNWDDDLGGSPVYAENDPNFANISAEEKQRLFELDRMVFFYLPRICNHCINPACVASCPSGALYKRGEDGIVLLNQEVCRGWRYCVSACPYKKTYYNWATGKSEKCILCYPRLETGQAPACMHSCVGRIRYLGVLLYDADRITEAANVSDDELVEAQKEMILDPFNETIIAEAKKNGISDDFIDCAQRSPVYKFYKKWGLALPLHPEYRTLPMLFYVPPLLPIMSSMTDGSFDCSHDELFTPIDKARVPIAYMAKLFSAGNEGKVRYALKKQYAVRMFRRQETVDDLDPQLVKKILLEAECSEEEAEAIYRLTSLATFDDRFVIPGENREASIENLTIPLDARGSGMGFLQEPKRTDY